jgi:hypothetical protein
LWAFVIVLVLVAYSLHGGLYRRETRRDEKLNRLIDERIDRMDIKRGKND